MYNTTSIVSLVAVPSGHSCNDYRIVSENDLKGS